MANRRSPSALRAMMGPHGDLSARWGKHCEGEFVNSNPLGTLIAAGATSERH